MRSPDFVPRLLIVAALWAIALPTVATLAQETAPPQNDPSPATRHAQVIAHGVVTMPADEIGWRVTVERAVLPHRATPQKRSAGFVLADDGTVAVTDSEGTVLARIAPGEAVWVAPETLHAVVSLEKHAVDYVDIALQPAVTPGQGGLPLTIDPPFAAPPGDGFDVDLLRDVLERDEESVLPAGLTPSVLLVTDGAVWVTPGVGETVQLPAGGAVRIETDAVVTGASRAPAAFVVARVGPEVPARVGLKDTTPHPAPAPIATPVSGAAATASLSLSAAICPLDDDGSTDATVCTIPASGVEFSFEADGETVASTVADDAGEAVLPSLPPGDYLLDAGSPGDFTRSRVRCLNDSGPNGGESAASNHAAISLMAGDNLACTVFLVPGSIPDDLPTLPADTVADLDTDGDGLTDRDETDFFGTDARDRDTDDDGLDDAAELLIHGANPLLVDTDGDGAGDGAESSVGTDPIDAASVPEAPAPAPEATPFPASSPAPDLGLDSAASPSAGGDSIPGGDLDGDGLSTADEIGIHGTNPADADSDGDGFSDGGEVVSGRNPLDPSDGR